ncbi:hypothetical protein F7Q99_30555 [Streptomyces kaniharaensis]|uniref:Transposase n=1 Tax=Streptomyces kaniharaensis TaxID=212423 RepID=A0A6N7L3L3_9ACTN|nr:hypothetical protein [Streptomyces kaniharaensis]MQS16423.1 hypothetical protein [Streptomyces kaniharaensis]
MARFNEGCHNALRLHRELAERGLAVSERTVRRFVHRLRENAKPTTRPLVPKVREVTALILTHPDHRSESQQVFLKELRIRSQLLPSLDNQPRQDPLRDRFAAPGSPK